MSCQPSRQGLSHQQVSESGEKAAERSWPLISFSGTASSAIGVDRAGVCEVGSRTGMLQFWSPGPGSNLGWGRCPPVLGQHFFLPALQQEGAAPQPSGAAWRTMPAELSLQSSAFYFMARLRLGDTVVFDPLTRGDAENPFPSLCSRLPSYRMEFSRKISRSL